MEKDKLELAAERLQNAVSYWAPQFENIRDDRRIASGFRENPVNSEEGDFPNSSIPIIQPTINKIVNELRANPFGIKVSTENPEVTKLYQGLIRDIEYASNASDAYATGFLSGVSTGMGAFAINTEYADDESLNQVIRINKIDDVTSVLLDPSSTAIDGSDAEYAFLLNWIDKSTAAREYGLDADSITKDPKYPQMFRNLQPPKGAVPETIYFEKVRKNVKRTWLTNGEYFDGEPELPIRPEFIAGSRKIAKTTVKVTKYIGTEEVESTELKTKYIPIVMVYGERVYGNLSRDSRNGGDPNWRGWAGITKAMYEPQELLNLSVSREKLLIEHAPIATLTAPAESMAGFEEDFSKAHLKPFANLPYNHRDGAGELLPAPSRMDNAAQTGFLAQAQGTAIELAQRASGVMDSALGREDVSQQSGLAMLTKQKSANLVTAHYMDNMAKSIVHAGRIVVELIDSIYDTERDIALRSASGEVSTVRVNMKETPVNPSKIDVKTEAGPMLMNERKETVATLLALGQIIPDKFSMFADILVKNLGGIGSDEVSRRLVAMLPPELRPQDEENAQAPDPQAMAALQQADQTISELEAMADQYEAIIQNLQAQIMSNQLDNTTRLQTSQIDAEIKLATSELESATRIEVERIKAGAKAQETDKKLAADARDRILDIADKTIDQVDVMVDEISITPEEAMKHTRKVGGPITGKLDRPEEADEAVEDIQDLLGKESL